MQDIIKKYKNHKIVSNIGIIVTSFIVALGVNFLLIDGTEIGQNLKANILGINNKVDGSDIYFEKKGDSKIILKTSKNIKSAKSIGLSIIYNPENIEIRNLTSSNSSISNIGKENGIKSIIINFDEAKDLKIGNNIIEFEVQKKSEQTENINIVNANFTDSNSETFLLTTSGITF